MGLRAGATTRREYQHIDLWGARPQQCARAGVNRCTGRQHIIDQQQAPAGHLSTLWSGGTRNAPWMLSARSVRDRPTCCGVAQRRLSPPCVMGTPQIADIARERTAN